MCTHITNGSVGMETLLPDHQVINMVVSQQLLFRLWCLSQHQQYPRHTSLMLNLRSFKNIYMWVWHSINCICYVTWDSDWKYIETYVRFMEFGYEKLRHSTKKKNQPETPETKAARGTSWNNDSGYRSHESCPGFYPKSKELQWVHY